ncbi:rhamnosyltransferase [Acetitomaculum ruminis DSM 5522]|uniref:Rhamnosyltransferase n=1 Tax=Acetitomaculum ruminis DSM 5522 TaxID=1120918 RepID=A0A1I0YLS7_9FIRM|nr:glycosyltransferase family 2 protein [Acetitomaculum ruminis]SFB13268.1 rhamnosyltransferase [Acetitomaculum ruminis DSM 5522]
MNNDLKVDIIIPVYKANKEFKETMAALLGQSYAVNRYILINTEEKYWDKSIESLSDKIYVKHIKKEEFDHGKTRDMAVKMSEGDIVICMTQDAICMDKYLVENMIKPFSDGRVWAVYARQLPRKDCRLIEKYTRSFNYPDKSHVRTKDDFEKYGIKTIFCSNVCAAYRKKIYDRLGGFPQNAIFAEDMIFANKIINAGGAIYYNADAKVIHSHNYTGIQQFHRNFDIGVTHADHPEIFANLKSEGEGVKMVLSTMKYLLKKGKPHLLIALIYHSGMKYVGYKAGKIYKKLPKKLCQICSTDKKYFT